MHEWSLYSKHRMYGLSVFVRRMQRITDLLQQHVHNSASTNTTTNTNTISMRVWIVELSVCERWQWSVWLYITYTQLHQWHLH